MTTYNEVRLKNIINDLGYVELTIVDEDGKVSEMKIKTFDEAKQEIESLENENEVYF